MASVHELARKSLDERWIPIRDAKTLEEMERYCIRTDCCFCNRAEEIDVNGMLTCYGSGCPLSSKNKPIWDECCNGKFDSYFKALVTTKDFAAAKDAAADICNQLQALLDAPVWVKHCGLWNEDRKEWVKI